ncbi:MAG: PAS domain S-box protein [Bacteroidota bacterium]|nr:PAS domain S-box protein [Bacteroidota bacterium]
MNNTACVGAEIIYQQNLDSSNKIKHNISSIIYILDITHGRNIYCSPQVTKILGYTTADLIAMGNNFPLSIMHPADKLLLPELRRKLVELQGEETFEWEYRLQHKNGSWQHFIGQESIYNRDEDGSFREIIGTALALDLVPNSTSEKSANQNISANDELYRLISENSTDLISLHYLDYTAIYYSSSSKDLLGYEAEELLRFAPFQLIHPDDVSQLQQSVENGLHSDSPYLLLQYRIRKKSGEYIWFESTTKLIKDENGQAIRLQSSSRDITERKKAEVALEKSERKYRDLVLYSQVIIFTHTLDGIILSTNPILQNLLGYTEFEMIGLPFTELLRSRDRKRYQEYLKDIQQHNKVVGVITVLDKKGQPKHLLYHNIKVNEPEVEPYVIAFAQDITERLEAENKLKKAKIKAEQSAKSKELFLANMSHEIRTPMNGILGMAALLKKTNLNDTQQNYLKLIQESAQNLLVIINDVLDLAKIESGKLELEKISFSVNEILQSACQSLTYKAEEKDILLHLKPLSLVNPLVTGDPYRLTQILINLLSNAIKFTDVGKIELSAEVVKETIFDYTLRFSVSDTGIGIPANKLDSIFESFVQANSDTTRKYGGTGLGLSICKNLVELQGGRIWVKSKLRQGTTFTFEITYPKAHLEQESSSTSISKIDYSSLQSLKVLLAEDNAINQFVAESILTDWGVHVQIARNGKEAIKLHRENSFDLILMDIQMPEMGGVEATRIIRQMPDPIKAQIPIIALTANALKGDSDTYLQAGMNDYMSKPYEEEKLFYKIYQNVHPNSANMKAVEDLAKENTVTDVPVKNIYSLELVQKLAKGDLSFTQQMVSMFVTIIPEAIQNMQAHVAAEDWYQLGQVAHSIKPAIDTLMITSIREKVVKVETDGKNAQNVADLPQLVSDISSTLQAVITDLKEEFTN